MFQRWNILVINFTKMCQHYFMKVGCTLPSPLPHGRIRLCGFAEFGVGTFPPEREPSRYKRANGSRISDRYSPASVRRYDQIRLQIFAVTKIAMVSAAGSDEAGVLLSPVARPLLLG